MNYFFSKTRVNLIMEERYSRHNMIDWFDQQALKQARIIIIGAGAVGNEVIKNLTLLGIGSLHVFDFDKIEEHNLTRCVLFRDSDIGSYKSDVAVNRCRELDPNVNIQSTHTDFWDSLTLDEIKDSDAVISCVDNFEARISLNHLCQMMSTDFYNTGIDSRSITAEFYPFSANSESACYECNLPINVYSRINERYSCGWLRKVAFEDNKIPTTMITASMAGAAVVSMLLNRLNKHPQALQGALRYFQDGITLTTTISTLIRKEDCFSNHSVNIPSLHLKAKRHFSLDSLIPLSTIPEGKIILSEQVLIRGKCKQCGREQEYYETTRKLNDAVSFCHNCGVQSVELTFEDSLSFDEFIKIFSGRDLPCKYVIFRNNNHQFIIEMED
jgi:molybdopterin-synthase adenylyltransferase